MRNSVVKKLRRLAEHILPDRPVVEYIEGQPRNDTPEFLDSRRGVIDLSPNCQKFMIKHMKKNWMERRHELG